MGPERKDKLKRPQESEIARLTNETEELVLTSKRQTLAERAKELAEQHVRIVEVIKRRKE